MYAALRPACIQRYVHLTRNAGEHANVLVC